MKITCLDCGETKGRQIKGLCGKCYQRKYHLENLEKEKARKKKYRLKNKKKLTASRKKYYLENPKKVKAQVKKYSLKYPERVKAAKKKYRLKNKKKLTAKNKKWHLENPKKQKAYVKKYSLENPGKRRELSLKRRGYGSPKKGVVDKVITENILKYGLTVCEKCENPCQDNFHIDHIHPLSKGGSSGYENLQILCEHCNCSKHTKTADYRGEQMQQPFLRIEI